MRKQFSTILYNRMLQNKDIYLITADLGFGIFDNIKNKFPDRFINTGASEQLAMGIATGLALNNKIPFIYSITSFVILRPFEIIRTYIINENIPVQIIGSGYDKDYYNNGISHWATDIPEILNTIGLNYMIPKDNSILEEQIDYMIKSKKPNCIILKK
jgi:transketolase